MVRSSRSAVLAVVLVVVPVLGVVTGPALADEGGPQPQTVVFTSPAPDHAVLYMRDDLTWYLARASATSGPSSSAAAIARSSATSGDGSMRSNRS